MGLLDQLSDNRPSATERGGGLGIGAVERGRLGRGSLGAATGRARSWRDAEQHTRSRAELAEQRLRIARDLHDVLANSLGVMVVHSEAAEELLVHNPERAAEAMRRVQDTGREALREVRQLFEPLRQLPVGDVGQLFALMRTAGPSTTRWSASRGQCSSSDPSSIGCSRRGSPTSSDTPGWSLRRPSCVSAPTQ